MNYVRTRTQLSSARNPPYPFRKLHPPARPRQSPLGNGLSWESSNLAVNGQLRVVRLPAPVITSITLAAQHTLQLRGQGVANQTYHVRASTNVALPLPQWWLLGSTSATAAGLILFADPLATNSQRFYRLAQ